MSSVSHTAANVRSSRHAVSVALVVGSCGRAPARKALIERAVPQTDGAPGYACDDGTDAMILRATVDSDEAIGEEDGAAQDLSDMRWRENHHGADGASRSWMCRDCEHHLPADPSEAVERETPKTPEEAVTWAQGYLSLMLHHDELLTESERRQTLAKAYHALKFAPSNWP